MHGPVKMINEGENGDDYVTSPSVLGKSWRLSDTSIDDVNVYARTMDLNPVVLQIARTRNVNPIDFEDFFLSYLSQESSRSSFLTWYGTCSPISCRLDL